MSDQWNFYALLVDSEPASIFVDLGVAKAAPLADFPNMAYLRVRMRNPRPDGLSSQDEYDDLIALENSISEAIERDGQSVYVGRNTSSGNRDFYFYTRNGSIEAVMRDEMTKWLNYSFQTGTRPDSEWSTYWRFLYPSPEDLQRMGNRDVVDRLLENGDSIDVARKIEHFAVFRKQDDRDGFVRYLTDNGYSISQTTNAADGEFQVDFDRIDQPVLIDDVTIDLSRAARQHNGDYDGWGCLTAS